MVTEHIGDLLESGCDIICHQVNIFGVFGGGLAKQIATKYPACEKFYKTRLGYVKECWGDDYILGEVLLYKNKHKNICIANCLSQNEDGTTNYKAVDRCFKIVYNHASYHHLKTIGVPKNYGCGIAIGNWEKVKAILVNIFQDKDIELQIWEKK